MHYEFDGTFENNLSQDLSREFLNKTEKVKKNATKQTLLTGSLYDGIWLDSLQCMDGHGLYTFPDGSVYRGYFQRGHFHGYGTLHLASPYNFTFKGTFIEGELDEIEDMWFDDGLRVDALIHGWNMDFSKWKYCTKEDRRYVDERREGIQPVGPFSRLTSEQPPRNLSENIYDVGEGIYNLSNNLLMQRPAPFPSIQFITCKSDKDWIIKNCRHGPLSEKKIDNEVCHKIIHCNLNSELEIAEHVSTCNHDQNKSRKRYFAKLCPEQTQDFENSEDSIGNHLLNSSSTCNSFSTTSLDFDIEEMLFLFHEYDQYNLGRDLDQEASIIVREGNKIC